MKRIICLILSVFIFAASFQNSLLLIDYQVNRTFYETHCVNQDKTEMSCHGKCQMKKSSEKSGNLFAGAKYALDIQMLPQPVAVWPLTETALPVFQKEVLTSVPEAMTAGFLTQLFQPPRV